MIGKDYEKLMKLTYKFEQKELYPSFKIRDHSCVDSVQFEQLITSMVFGQKKKTERDRLQPVRGLA